jgi:hypothetical protein
MGRVASWVCWGRVLIPYGRSGIGSGIGLGFGIDIQVEEQEN